MRKMFLLLMVLAIGFGSIPHTNNVQAENKKGGKVDFEYVYNRVNKGVIGVRSNVDIDRVMMVFMPDNSKASKKISRIFNIKAHSFEYYPVGDISETFNICIVDGDFDTLDTGRLNFSKMKELKDKILKSELIKFAPSSKDILFKQSTYFINFEKYSKDMESFIKTSGKTPKNVWNYMIHNYTYLNQTNRYPNLKEIINNKACTSSDINILFVSAMRKLGYPTKFAFGIRDNTQEFHAWTEIYFNNKWQIVDLTENIVNKDNKNMFQDTNRYHSQHYE